MTMTPTVRYRNWLRSLVDDLSSSHQPLFDTAWATFYIPSVPNDDNRADDGIALRDRFESETSIELDYLGDCRMLEFLVALSERLNIVTYVNVQPKQTRYWFWTLMENLDIGGLDTIRKITNAFERINERDYDSYGNGGLFPLEYPEEDQRNVEVWYQMMEYLREIL